MHLVGMETPSKAPFILDAVPGLAQFCDMGAAIRGSIDANGRCFVVAGSTLYEVSSAGVKTARGTLLTTTGAVWMRWGLTQLVIVDGQNGYTLTLGSNVFAQITSDAFYGSSTVSYLNGYFGFVRPDTQQFYVTAIDDASTLDALDFVSAERVPDGLVGAIDDHGQIIMFGSLSIEIWDGYSSSTFPYQRNNGASIEVGCMAAHSIRQADNGVFFIGRDKNGAGMVYRLASVTQPIRVSTVAVEEALAASTDLSQAVAWVYQERGLTFYCLNAPGVDSTWCYEISTGQWHERADIDGLGEFEAWRVDHCVFAHGKHLAGGSDGILYEMSREYQDFAGDASFLIARPAKAHRSRCLSWSCRGRTMAARHSVIPYSDQRVRWVSDSPAWSGVVWARLAIVCGRCASLIPPRSPSSARRSSEPADLHQERAFGRAHVLASLAPFGVSRHHWSQRDQRRVSRVCQRRSGYRWATLACGDSHVHRSRFDSALGRLVGRLQLPRLHPKRWCDPEELRLSQQHGHDLQPIARVHRRCGNRVLERHCPAASRRWDCVLRPRRRDGHLQSRNDCRRHCRRPHHCILVRLRCLRNRGEDLRRISNARRNGGHLLSTGLTHGSFHHDLSQLPRVHCGRHHRP
jgi:hypothetical protein